MTNDHLTSGQAWDRYKSCCLLGGSDDERTYAFNRWDRIDRAEHAATRVEQERADKRAARAAKAASA